jgi:hypothetical protein
MSMTRSSRTKVGCAGEIVNGDGIGRHGGEHPIPIAATDERRRAWRRWCARAIACGLLRHIDSRGMRQHRAQGLQDVCGGGHKCRSRFQKIVGALRARVEWMTRNGKDLPALFGGEARSRKRARTAGRLDDQDPVRHP